MDAGASDQIDAIIQGWERLAPEMDFAQKHVVLRVLAAAANFERVAEQAIEPYGLTMNFYKVLSELRRAEPEHVLTPKMLVRCMAISSGGLTALLDRMERAELVVREPDPSDRRGVRVRLTAFGSDKIEKAVQARAAAEEAALSVLSPADRETLVDLLQKVLSPYHSLAPANGSPGVAPGRV
ncbi:MAG: MarR family winged helix-turn-helix transcriptional regulator [Maricaulaceae bacterium]